MSIKNFIPTEKKKLNLKIAKSNEFQFYWHRLKIFQTLSQPVFIIVFILHFSVYIQEIHNYNRK